MNKGRLSSIDIYRALTMLLMIFVIDLWSISDVPVWLNHAAAAEDRMGLADIVFPCFLFIIGLSIPYAVQHRQKKGGDNSKVLLHILSRSVSLIIMGLLIVNLDNMQSETMIIKKSYWQLLIVLAILMIWNDYSFPKIMHLVPRQAVQILGWSLLGLLIFIYQGPTGSWMQIYWWGILGLLGWSYGVCAVLYLLIGNRILWLSFAVLIFLMLNINEFVGGFNLRLLISASNYFCVMLGVLSTVLLIKLAKQRSRNIALALLLAIALLLIAFGFITRPEWGISKIRATPSWTTICAGISLLLFLVMIVVADIRQCTKWANPILAGGTATLSCYFALYFVYATMEIMNLHWPEILSTGALGLIKSFCFSILVIQFTAWLGRFHIKLSV